MTPALLLALALALPGPGLAPVLPTLRGPLGHGAAAIEVWPDDPRFARLLAELGVPAGLRRDAERVRADRGGARVVFRGREAVEVRWAETEGK